MIQKKIVTRRVYVIIVYCSAFVLFWTIFFSFYFRFFWIFFLFSFKQTCSSTLKLDHFMRYIFLKLNNRQAEKSSQTLLLFNSSESQICLLRSVFVPHKRRFNETAYRASSHRFND